MKAWLVLLLFGASLAGFQQSKILLPDETAGLDGIVQTLVFAFDHFDIVALGENHWNKMDSDLRIALTLDRYIRGEDVPLAELQQVWKTTTQTDGIWDSPVYADLRGRPGRKQETVRPESQQFERALKTQARPVLVPFGTPPFRDMAFGASWLRLTLGQIADACVYFGIAPEVLIRPVR